VIDQWFSPGIPVSSTNKIDCHDITEILLKVALNSLTLTPITKVREFFEWEILYLLCKRYFRSESFALIIDPESDQNIGLHKNLDQQFLLVDINTTTINWSLFYGGV